MRVLGKSALSRTSDVECFDFLIESGADINVKGVKYQNSILHNAAYYNSPRSITQLIDYGAKIDAKNKRGQTPLHIAVEEGNLNIVKALLKHGADVSIVDNNNETPLDIAKRMNFPDIQKRLTEQSKTE